MASVLVPSTGSTRLKDCTPALSDNIIIFRSLDVSYISLDFISYLTYSKANL